MTVIALINSIAFIKKAMLFLYTTQFETPVISGSIIQNLMESLDFEMVAKSKA